MTRSPLQQWANALRPLGRRGWLALAREVAGRLPDLPMARDVTVGVTGEADLSRLATAMEPHRRAILDFSGSRPLLEQFQENYRRGDLCMIAELGGKIVYMGWTRFDEASMPSFGIEVKLRPGEAYGYAVFALPDYRSLGLATTVGVARLKWLREHNIQRFYGWINPRNAAILKLQERFGYSRVAHVDQLYWRLRRRLLLLNRVTYAPADPLADWCSPERLRFKGGIAIFRRGPAL